MGPTLLALAATLLALWQPIPMDAKAKHAHSGRHKHPKHLKLSKAEYLTTFKAEIRRLGRPDEATFLISIVPGESHGNHLVVSRAKGGWFCGPVQTMASGEAECRRIQRDPVYAAGKAIRILRAHDAIGGDRECNWKFGPNHSRCRALRGKPVPTS